MTSRHPWRAGLESAPELLLLLAILAAVANVAQFFLTRGYLPQPFIWDPQDTFMDWFNPAYWANREGAYSVWRSIYPPLSFMLLRVLSIPRCYASSPFAARDCDIVGVAAILVFYIACIVASFMAFRRHQPRVAMVRTIALAFSYPALFVLERGNLLIPCFLCFVLAYGDLLKSRWGQALAVAMTINFKPYLLVPAFAFAFKRRWRLLEAAGIATIAVYLISWGFVGAGSPGEVLANTAHWITFTGADFISEVYYTTSYNSFFGVLDRGFPILNFTGSKVLEGAVFSAKLAMLAAETAAIAALVGAWLQPRAATTARIVTLLLLASLINRSPGGYSELCVVFLVFLEPWRRPGPIIAIIAAYLISLPFDVIVAHLPPTNTGSWLTGQAVTGEFGIAVGQFVRPAGLLVILLSLSLDTIAEAMRAHGRHRPLLRLRRLIPVGAAL